MRISKARISSWLRPLVSVAMVAWPAVAPAAVIPATGVTLAWNPNPEPAVVGYKVHFGTESGVYADVMDVAAATRVQLPPVTLGTTYYMAVSAYNAAGEESPLSAELVVTAAVPEPPASLSTAITAPGEGALQWRHPKSTGTIGNALPVESFTIYASEDLENWQPAGTVSAAAATSSDDTWQYFHFPFVADKPRMFFRVGASNPFGEVQ